MARTLHARGGGRRARSRSRQSAASLLIAKRPRSRNNVLGRLCRDPGPDKPRLARRRPRRIACRLDPIAPHHAWEKPMNRFLCATGLLVTLTHGYVSVRASEPPEGFVALFNGKDLTGWKGLVADPPKRAKMSAGELAKAQAEADRSMRAHWRAEGGVIVFDGKGDSICTARDYGDFELLVDWKIEKDGDSGIYLRGSPQVQIWDRPDGSGGLYNNQEGPSKPLVKADRPVGEWNTFRIKMVGEKVTVHLNGVLVVDGVVLENYWERDKPIYPAGQIELQNHGNSLYFKDIFLREIPRPGAPGAGQGAGRSVLKRGALVAVVGDSITEQKLYSRFIEDYLVLCLADLELRAIQLGWSGERAPGFAARMENDLLPWKPDVVTTCYGMNDGGYRVYEPSIGETYGKAMREIVSRLKAAGSTVVVGSPGAVDTYSFRRQGLSPAQYNANLAQLRDTARDLAAEAGMPFANVHDAMVRAMEKAKPVLGEAYDVCGSDGFHPQANGHLVMAYAFLKGLGVDGQIATIAVDLKGGATASAGHKVLSASGGKVEIESARYPFCFSGDEKSPGGTRSIVPFVPFNEELNRFVLVVKGLAGERAKVAWGSTSKSFSRADLERGVNLAAEILDNPLREPFRKVDELVGRKQAFETSMIKEAITRFRTVRDLLGDDAGARQALEALRARFEARHAALAAEVRAAAAPVRHTIEVRGE
ncbi:MAG: DUF1080 domain-containing protein [Planctomycetes bacterium]|nr:DUF1080 domain-containing protein [Planctomycetota bacterium]